MDIIEAIHHRRAVRQYAPEPVGTELFRKLIDAAIQAPNALNRQAWSFVVITNRAVLDLCAEKAKAHCLAFYRDDPRFTALLPHLRSPDFHLFYDAPALIVICATDDDPMAQQDCCLAAENLMLAADHYGLGTCWIGLAEDWLNQPAAKTELDIPAAHRPVAPIIVGRPRHQPPPVPRRDPHIIWIVGDEDGQR